MKKNTSRKVFAATASAALIASAVAPAGILAADQEKGFTDVPVKAYYFDAVNYLASKGIIQGINKEGTLFDPNGLIDRAQTAEVMAKALELPAAPDSGFTDVVPGKWYVDSINKVVAAGILGDTNAGFQPHLELDRAQAAKVIVDAYGLEGSGDLSTFPDAHLVPEWSKKHFAAAVENGIINGKEVDKKNWLAPNDNITRGEFATMLKRAIDKVNEDEVEEGVAVIKEVSAISANSVDVTFTGNPAGLTAKDFKVKGDGLSVVSVEVKGSKATIEFNKDMTDGAEYTLQLIDEEENVLNEKDFEYHLGAVANISLTKATFEKGEKLTNFLKVFDDKGVEVASANYNIVDIQSSNTEVVDNDVDGTVKDEGTANVRFKVEYKDGSFEWSDFITVNVEQAITAELAGYHLDAATADAYPNTVAYLKQEDADGNNKPSKTVLTESSAADLYLQVYADDSKGNPQIHALDLKSDGDYEVKSLDSSVATVLQDGTGVKLNYVAPGNARILITGKDGYKKTVTVKVSKDPEYKDLVLGATELKLSDEVLTSLNSLNNEEDGVTNDTVKLKWKDQNDDLTNFDLSSGVVNADKDQIVKENVIKQGDKIVVSSANTNGAFELGIDGNDLEVTAQKDKEVKNASIRVSYYADKTATKPTTQKVIATSVADIDASKPAADYQTSVDKSAIDPNSSNNKATVTAYAVDKNGNKVGNVTEQITLTANESVSRSEQEWFDIAGRKAGTVIAPSTGTLANEVTFTKDAEYYMTESGAIKVNYTVAGASDPHGTVTLSYDNSFAAPDKVAVNTKPVVIDFADDLYGDKINVNSLLFGKINGVNAATNYDSADLVIDLDSKIYNGTDDSSTIAIKQGKTGYTNNAILSVLGKDGKAIDSGSALYGLDLGNGSLSGNGYVVNKADGTYNADTTFNVEYSISNAKNLEQTQSGTAGNSNLGNKLSITSGKDQASFTIVITKVTVKGDIRKDNSGYSNQKNLLDAPKSIDVILK